MTTNPSAELLDNLLTTTGQTAAVRAEVRVWSMSGVERVTFPDDSTAIFKYAKKPFDSEDQALRLARTLGVPVPQIHGSAVVDGWLGMLMEDLGPSARDADDLDGVAAAVVLHGARTAAALPVFDRERLRALPVRALGHLEGLRKADRWQDTGDVEDALDKIARAAEARLVGATLAPFGWVHSEFHPIMTSSRCPTVPLTPSPAGSSTPVAGSGTSAGPASASAPRRSSTTSAWAARLPPC